MLEAAVTRRKVSGMVLAVLVSAGLPSHLRKKGGGLMAWLKIYQWEHLTYTEFQDVKLDMKRAAAIIKRLSRHFKVSTPELIGTRRGGGGDYWNRGDHRSLIRVCWKKISLGLVCHEFAHHLTARRWGSAHGHDKKFKRELKRVYSWAKRWLPEKEKNVEASVPLAELQSPRRAEVVGLPDALVQIAEGVAG